MNIIKKISMSYSIQGQADANPQPNYDVTLVKPVPPNDVSTIPRREYLIDTSVEDQFSINQLNLDGTTYNSATIPLNVSLASVGTDPASLQVTLNVDSASVASQFNVAYDSTTTALTLTSYTGDQHEVLLETIPTVFVNESPLPIDLNSNQQYDLLYIPLALQTQGNVATLNTLASPVNGVSLPAPYDSFTFDLQTGDEYFTINDTSQDHQINYTISTALVFNNSTGASVGVNVLFLLYNVVTGEIISNGTPTIVNVPTGVQTVNFGETDILPVVGVDNVGDFFPMILTDYGLFGGDVVLQSSEILSFSLEVSN